MRRAATLSRNQSIFTTLSSNTHDQNRSLAHANSLLRNAMDKKIDFISAFMSELASKLHISDQIVQKGIDMALKLLSLPQFSRGYSKETLTVSILYIVCTLEGYPRTISEISKISFIARKHIGHLSSLILQQLGIQKGVIQPEKLVHRFASQLHLSFTIAEYAREMCILIANNEVVDSSTAPQVIAAASIVLVCEMNKEEFKIQDLEKVSSSSANSILKMKTSLERYSRVITPSKLKETLSKKRERKEETEEKERSLKMRTNSPLCA